MRRQIAARNIVNLQQPVHDLFPIGGLQGTIQLGQGDRAKIDAERLGQAVRGFQAVVESFHDPLQHGPRHLMIGSQTAKTAYRRGAKPKADQIVQNLPLAVADHGTDFFQAEDLFAGRDQVARREPQPETDQVQSGNFAQLKNEIRIGRNLFQRLKFVELELPPLESKIERVEARGVLSEELAGETHVSRRHRRGGNRRGVNQPRPNAVFAVRGDEPLRGLSPRSQSVQTRVERYPSIDGRGRDQLEQRR